MERENDDKGVVTATEDNVHLALIRKYNYTHAKVAPIVVQLETLTNEPPSADFATRSQQAQRLRMKAAQISCLLPEISNIVDQLTMHATTHAEYDDLQQQSDDFNDFCIRAKMTVAAAEALALDLVTSPIATAAIHQSSRHPLLPSTFSTAKLPKQTLPRFDGDVMKFRTFWQQFEASIDQNTSLTNIQKLNYLLPLLEKEAKKSIEGLDIQDSSYPVAVEILKSRYGDNTAVIRKLHNRFASLPVCGNDHEDLESFLNELEAICRTLKTLGNPLDGQFVATHAYARLPADFCEKLSRSKRPEDSWTVELLLEKFLSEVKMKKDSAEGKLSGADVFELSSTPQMTTGEALVAHHRQDRRSLKPQQNSRQNGFERRRDVQPNERQPKCQLCERNNEHFVSDCRKYSTAPARYEQARALKLCLNCLSPGHIAKECRSQKSCYNCHQAGHHSGLCRKRFADSHSDSPTQWSKTSPNARSYPKANARVKTALVADGTDDNNDAEVCEGFDADRCDDTHSEGTNHTSLTTQTKRCEQSALLRRDEKVTLLQSARATVSSKNGEKCKTVRLLLDTCSNRTYVTTKLAKSLGLPMMDGRPLEVNVFGSSETKRIPTKMTEISLQTRDDDTLNMVATVLPSITGQYQREAMNCDALRLLNCELELADHMPDREESVEIDMLIGNDYYADIVLGPRRRVDEGLYLLQSRLGWVLAGRAEHSQVTSRSHVMTGIALKCHSTESELPQRQFAVNAYPYLTQPPCLSDLWSLDALGIKDEPSKKEEDDEEAMAQFKRSIRMENGRYVARFPWIEEKVDQLPDNYDAALKRLKSLTKRLKERPKLLQKYDDIITEQLRAKITEVTDLEQEPEGPVNYLPHREIEKPDKETTKVRIVYDASCRQNRKGLSVNDCMRRGPVFLENLSGILLRFRLSPIALVADIEKAFHQVVLDNRDRDATRFLWLRDVRGDVTPENIIVLRFQRVLFGAKASPMLLEATIDHHLTSKNSETCRKINGNIYMDNLVTGASSTEEALHFYHETKSVFAEIGMNMREWTSNNQRFLQNIPEKDRCRPKNVKILGMEWMTATDSFCFNVPKKSLVDVKTKRDLVGAVAAVFDPNGLILPVTLKGKILLQRVDQTVRQWDKQVPESILAEWMHFLEQLKQLSDVVIPRYVPEASTSNAKYQLHCFTDASDKCYAAAIYLRIVHGSEISVHLIFAKGRVNPVRKLTIPRLELMGVLIGVRALNYVARELRITIDERYLWSDSSCVLQWLRSTRDLGRFVNNRVKEIRKSTDISFKFVSSKDNVADIPTRTMETNTIPERWFTGPEWLKLKENGWPDVQLNETTQGNAATAYVAPSNEHSERKSSSPFGIDNRKFSSLTKLLRVTAWCRRFVDNLKDKKPTHCAWLTAEELKTAELQWLKYEQIKAGYAHSDKDIQRNHGRLMRKLGVFQDANGIVRCKGRFGHSSLSYTAKYPALLPKQEHFTRLAIEWAHEATMHSGTAQTLAKVRTCYWIAGGRNKVRSTIAHCVTCRKYEGHPFAMQVMPDLPPERTTAGVAFENVGIDYFGPLYVKSQKPCVEVAKVWCVLFVCLKVRAVHLEMVQDMTTASFLLAFRRFVTRYGKPSTVISDNASQFELADAVLQKLWIAVEQDEELHNYCSTQDITWQKITQYAPWQGGVYERLVKTVKRPLRKVLHHRTFSADQLRTILYEVAAVVNSRPLIATPATDNDFSMSSFLTPAHFLHPHPKVGIPCYGEDLLTDNVTTRDALIQEWKKGSQLLDVYWELWLNLYLPGLREQQTLYHQQSRNAVRRSPEIDEIVIVQDENRKRGTWKLGQIKTLIRGTDGKVRSAQVKMPTGKMIQRAINHLYPLECGRSRIQQAQPGYPQSPSNAPATADENGASPMDSATMTNQKEKAIAKQTRPQRAAAKQALMKIKDYL